MKSAATFLAALHLATLLLATPLAAQPSPISQSAIAHVLCLTERMRTLVRENPARRDDEILDQVFLDCADRRDASREEIVKAGRSLADANKAVEALERALRPSLKDDIAKMKAQLPPR